MTEAEKIKAGLIEVPTLVELFKSMKEKFFPAQFKDVKLADGTIIRYDGDTPQVGAPVKVIATDGTMADVPDGEYPIDELSSILVVAGGLITEVKPMEAKAEGEGAAVQEQSSNDAAVKTLIESIIKESHFVNEESFNKVTESVKTLTETFESVTKELKDSLVKEQEFKKEMFSIIEKMANSASVITPVKKKEVKPTDLVEFRKKAFNL